jgi:hypothetical protein
MEARWCPRYLMTQHQAVLSSAKRQIRLAVLLVIGGWSSLIEELWILMKSILIEPINRNILVRRFVRVEKQSPFLLYMYKVESNIRRFLSRYRRTHSPQTYANYCNQSEPLFTRAFQIDKGGQPASYCLSFGDNAGVLWLARFLTSASIVIDLH